MRIDIFRGDNKKRDHYEFAIVGFQSEFEIRFEEFTREERASNRHKWKRLERWNRLDSRAPYTTMSKPAIPEDVDREVRVTLTALISKRIEELTIR